MRTIPTTCLSNFVKTASSGFVIFFFVIQNRFFFFWMPSMFVSCFFCLLNSQDLTSPAETLLAEESRLSPITPPSRVSVPPSPTTARAKLQSIRSLLRTSSVELNRTNTEDSNSNSNSNQDCKALSMSDTNQDSPDFHPPSSPLFSTLEDQKGPRELLL